MRLFFGLPVPQSLQLEIAAWRDRNLPPMQRFVPAANYHITLAFLGQIPVSRLDSFIDETSRLLSDPSFQQHRISIDQTGFWPKPGILWIGPSHCPDALALLAKRLGTLGQKLGIRSDKRAYQAHITLARHCETPCKPTREPDFDLLNQEVVLYESISQRGGVIYEAVEHWRLHTPLRGNLPPRSKHTD